MSNIPIEKYTSVLVGEGNIITAAAILSNNLNTPVTPGRPRNIICAQKGMNLKGTESTHILEQTTKNTIHLDYVQIGNVQYLITSVQERSFYGRNTDTKTGGGIIIVKTAKSVLVATYPQHVLPSEAVPIVESFAETIPQ